MDRVENFILSGISEEVREVPIEHLHGDYQPYLYCNSAFNNQLTIDFCKEEFEIPSFCLCSAIDIMRGYTFPGNNNNNNNIVINASVASMQIPTEIKQLKTILRDMLMARCTLAKITNNNNVYYGLPGTVLNSDFDPLMTIKVKVKREDNIMIFTDYKCYISPKVFDKQDGIMEKFIYKKVIPFCASYKLGEDLFPIPKFQYLINNNVIKTDWEGKRIEVIISNDIKCFNQPVPPSISDDINKEMNKILLDNISLLTV